MRDKGSPSKVCTLLPHSGKEVHTKVEKDFTVLLSTSGMVSNTDMCLCNGMKILQKTNRVGFCKKDKFWHMLCNINTQLSELNAVRIHSGEKIRATFRKA